jgi:Flp pilus assembly protein TadD
MISLKMMSVRWGVALLLGGTALGSSVEAQLVQPAFREAPGDALTRHLRTIAEQPRNVAALTGAGRAALELGDPQAALTFFARAEEIAPRDGRIKAAIGAAFVATEQVHAALKFFSDAASLGVPEAEFAGDRGLAYDLLGNPALAQADYNAALRRREDSDVRRRLALSLAISGNRDQALATIAEQLRVQDRAAWRTRSFILALTGDADGATQAAQSVMPAQAQQMRPFFAALPALKPAERAMAVHFGHFPHRRPPPPGRRRHPICQRRDRHDADACADDPFPCACPGAELHGVAPPDRRGCQSKPAGAPRQLARGALWLAHRGAPSGETGSHERGRTDPACDEARRAHYPGSSRSAAGSRSAQPDRSRPAATSRRHRSDPGYGSHCAFKRISTGGACPDDDAAAPRHRPPARKPDARRADAGRDGSPPDASGSRSVCIGTPGRRRDSRLRSSLGSDRHPGSACRARAGIQVAELAPSAAAVPTPIQRAPSSGILAQPPAAASQPAPAQAAPEPPTALASIADTIATLADQPAPTPPPADAEPKKPAYGPKIETPAVTKVAAKTETERPEPKKPEPKKPEAKKPEPKKSEPAAPKEPSRHWVQIAGGANEAAMNREFSRIKAKAPKLLASRTAWTTPLRATNRLLVGPFKSNTEAQEFVNELAKLDLPAFSWTSPAGQEIVKLASK